MAITPLTGFKALEFDGETSTDYGVQILGEGVFNAPKREVQMISIPGRNGAYALDKGRFENIDVKYPAHLIADSTADFAEAVSDFRNMLCSRRGYCRLTDDYHPEEYRMAVYKSGLEVDEKVLRAGKFNIVFDCKPQRWLTSGEDAVTVSDGDELTNPTLHDASPLLEVKGYGTIGFNNYAIEIDNAHLGSTTIASGYSGNITAQLLTVDLDTSMLNEGDAITVESASMAVQWERNAAFSGGVLFGAPTITPVEAGYPDGMTASCSTTRSGKTGVRSTPVIQNASFEYGTAADYAFMIAVDISPNTGSGFAVEASAHPSIGISYDGDSTITIQVQPTITGTGASRYTRQSQIYTSHSDIIGVSSKSMLGNPTYIDCELGQAYRIDGGTMVSLNKNIDLGSDLPKLAPGANLISFDNTVTELKIVPRWWKI